MKVLTALISLVVLFSSCNNSKNKTNLAIGKENQHSYELIDLPAKATECGVIKNFVGFRFKRLYDGAFVILLVPCPESFGQNFFVQNKVYDVQLSKTSEKFTDYVITNEYRNESLDSFEIDKIERLDR